MTPDPLRVAVISRYQLVRAGLATLIHSDPSRAIVVDPSPHSHRPGLQDVAVYDLAGAGGDDAHADHDDLHRLVASGIPVVGLVRDGRHDLAHVAFTHGVHELVSERVTGEELLDALDRAAGRATEQGSDDDPLDLLTHRELEVLRLVAAGASNKEIAGHLYVSINTVKSYIRTSYRKIGAGRRAEAVLWAAHRGLAARPPDSSPPAPPPSTTVGP